MPYVDIINKLKEGSDKCKTRELEKNLVKIFNKDYENYDVGCAINYLIDSDNYEVYMFIGSGSEMIASNIMCNIFKSKTDAINYYEELVNIIELNDLNAILDKVLQEKN